MNKYETGKKDNYGNREFDFAKAFADLKKVVLGKAKFSKALYEVMHLRFTIAHYNAYGWMCEYNGNWDMLADQIYPSNYGGFIIKDTKPFDDIRDFLYRNARATVDVDKMFGVA